MSLSFIMGRVYSQAFSTAFIYHFRTREELDRYLEASQIRQRAIERVTNVVGTYGPVFSIIIFFKALLFRHL